MNPLTNYDIKHKIFEHFILPKLKVTIKGYLCYKAILCHKGSPWCVINEFFLFEEKIMFRSQDTEIFVFLWNLQISKSVTLL